MGSYAMAKVACKQVKVGTYWPIFRWVPSHGWPLAHFWNKTHDEFYVFTCYQNLEGKTANIAINHHCLIPLVDSTSWPRTSMLDCLFSLNEESDNDVMMWWVCEWFSQKSWWMYLSASAAWFAQTTYRPFHIQTFRWHIVRQHMSQNRAYFNPPAKYEFLLSHVW